MRPEKQDLDIFVNGVQAIVDAQRSVALNYFDDGSVEAACPPIKALLHIMAYGECDGMRESDAEFRALFTRESLLASDWYRDRLRAKQSLDVALWTRHRDSVVKFLRSGTTGPHVDWDARLAAAHAALARASSPAYLAELAGTIGADPLVLDTSVSEIPDVRTALSDAKVEVS